MRDLTVVRSADNARFRALLRLTQSSRRRRLENLSVLDGAHLVTAYFERYGQPLELVASATALSRPEVAGLFDRFPGAARMVLADALFARLSSLVTPAGIIGVVNTPRPDGSWSGKGAAVMLEGLQDPGNLGSILRSAAAAGVETVLLSPDAVHAWSPRVLRAGMGAHFALRIYERVDLVGTAGSYGGRIIAASQHASRTIYDTALDGEVALVFGNEGGGVSAALRAVAHAEAAIPMPGHGESLNVAAAAAVCLFERVRQQVAAARRAGSRPPGRARPGAPQ